MMSVRWLTFAAALFALVFCASADSILRALDEDGVSIAWNKAAGDGDLTLTHGPCEDPLTFLTFEEEYEDRAALNRGFTPGPSREDIPGSIRLRTEANGFSDVEGFVRGEWRSLSQPTAKTVPAYTTTTLCDAQQSNGDSCAAHLPALELSIEIYKDPAASFDPMVVIGGFDGVYFYQCKGNDCGRPPASSIRLVEAELLGVPAVVPFPSTVNPNAVLMLGLRLLDDGQSYGLSLVNFDDFSSVSSACSPECGSDTAVSDLPEVVVLNTTGIETQRVPGYFKVVEPQMVLIDQELHIVYYSQVTEQYEYIFCTTSAGISCVQPVTILSDPVNGQGLPLPSQQSRGQRRSAGDMRLRVDRNQTRFYFVVPVEQDGMGGESYSGKALYVTTCTRVLEGFAYTCATNGSLNIQVKPSLENYEYHYYADNTDPGDATPAPGNDTLPAELTERALPDGAFDVVVQEDGQLFWVIDTLSHGLVSLTCEAPCDTFPETNSTANYANRTRLLDLVDVEQRGQAVTFTHVQIVQAPDGTGMAIVAGIGNALDVWYEAAYGDIYPANDTNSARKNFGDSSSIVLRCNDTVCSEVNLVKLSPYLAPHGQGLIDLVFDERSGDTIVVAFPTYGAGDPPVAQSFSNWQLSPSGEPCDLERSGRVVVSDGVPYLCTLLVHAQAVDNQNHNNPDLYSWVALGNDLRNDAYFPIFRQGGLAFEDRCNRCGLDQSSNNDIEQQAQIV